MIHALPSAPASSPAAMTAAQLSLGMRRLEREIRVVAVEVADMDAVGERRPVGRGRSAADQADRRRALRSRGDPPRDRRRGLVERTDRAAQGIEQPAAGLDHHRRRQVFKARFQSERDQPISQGVRHRSSLNQVHRRNAGRERPIDLRAGQSARPECRGGPRYQDFTARRPVIPFSSAPVRSVLGAGYRNPRPTTLGAMPTCSRRMRCTSRMASGSLLDAVVGAHDLLGDDAVEVGAAVGNDAVGRLVDAGRSERPDDRVEADRMRRSRGCIFPRAVKIGESGSRVSIGGQPSAAGEIAASRRHRGCP